MADVKVIIDGNEYSEEEFKRDIIRMFDSLRKGGYSNWGSADCGDIGCSVCSKCPLSSICEKFNEVESYGSYFQFFFEAAEAVYRWAKEHPVFTNKDMLKKTFGKDVIHYIEARPYKEEWLDEEYKEPSKESCKEEKD